MNNYELTYLISPDRTEEEVKNIQEKIISFIQEGGILIDTNLPKKRILSYPIKKKGVAFLALINFQFKAECLADFEKKIKAEDNILRYLILKREGPKASKFTKGQVEISKKIKEPKEKKVKLEEIEEKLKELDI